MRRQVKGMGCTKKSNRKWVHIFLLWLAILAVAIVPRIVKEPTERTAYRFLRVIDGDTIEVQRGQEAVRVRLIGVDAPESVHPEEERNTQFGEAATDYAEELLSQTAYVYLEYDREQYDSYNRLLAYVYWDDEAPFEESLNYRLVEEGYAVNSEYKPNVKYANELQKACERAKEQRKGLWETEGLFN